MNKIITDEVSENRSLMKCKVKAEESFRSIRVIVAEDGFFRMTCEAQPERGAANSEQRFLAWAVWADVGQWPRAPGGAVTASLN